MKEVKKRKQTNKQTKLYFVGLPNDGAFMDNMTTGLVSRFRYNPRVVY